MRRYGFVWFVVNILIVFLCTGCQPRAPVVHSISPQIGTMGEPITIKGAFFGNSRDESYITLAGAQPTGTSYLSWKHNEIIFRLPEFGEAGLIYVYVNGKKSNGVLFTNQATLPSRVLDNAAGTGPVIIAIAPQAGAIGSLINITGTGFGNARGNGGVFFPWNAEMSAFAPIEAMVQEFAEVSEFEFGYELWTDKEIRVRIPDGAASGDMEVRTARGNSFPRVFDIAGRPGSKTFRDKRSYTMSYSVDVRVGEAATPNSLYLWIPRPAVSAAQRNIEILASNVEPFVDRFRGTSLFKLDNLSANSTMQVRISWKTDVYSVETTILPHTIRQETQSPFNGTYTQSTAQLPSDNPRIKNQAAAIVGRERNPYLKAQRMYEWMLASNFVWENQLEGDVFTMLDTKQADSYLAALLYCALLRSVEVPCQPVAGVLVNRNRQTMHHYWVEFWIDGFGWVPVDPAMGAGAIPAPFGIQANRAAYYFGNIDSQRIAFSRGFINLSPMDPRGRTVAPQRSFSLQNIREEVVGGIESYSSLWGDITITGIYAQ